MIRNYERVQVFNDEPSRTHQSFKAECDIRNIMKKYKKTGVLNHVNSSLGKFGDFANVSTYQEALNVIISSQTMFDSLPAELRLRFGNDPSQFLDFVNNPDNVNEMGKLGIIIQPKAEVLDKKESAVADSTSGST